MEGEDESRERAHGNVDALVANLVQSYQRILRHLKVRMGQRKGSATHGRAIRFISNGSVGLCGCVHCS